MEGNATDQVRLIDASVIQRLISGYTPQVVRRDSDTALLNYQNGTAGDDILAQIMGTNQAPPSLQHDAQYLNDMMRFYDEEMGAEGSTGGSVSSSHHREVERLPTKALDESMMEADGTAYCTICREEVGKGKRVKVMYCKHWFHIFCLESWLLEPNDSCPVCRMPMREAKQKFHAESDTALAIASGGRRGSAESPAGTRRGVLGRLWRWTRRRSSYE